MEKNNNFIPIEYKGLIISKYVDSNWYAVTHECPWISGEDKVVYRCKSIERCKEWIDKHSKLYTNKGEE